VTVRSRVPFGVLRRELVGVAVVGARRDELVLREIGLELRELGRDPARVDLVAAARDLLLDLVDALAVDARRLRDGRFEPLHQAGGIGQRDRVRGGGLGARMRLSVDERTRDGPGLNRLQCGCSHAGYLVRHGSSTPL
jgi:hypothetical protein